MCGCECGDEIEYVVDYIINTCEKWKNFILILLFAAS